MGVKSITEPILTGDPTTTKLMVGLLSIFAEMESDKISQRTKAGLAEARAKGSQLGRREVTATDARVLEARRLSDMGHNATEIGKFLSKDGKPVSRQTVYRWLKLTEVI